jgi:hypothetical protein
MDTVWEGQNRETETETDLQRTKTTGGDEHIETYSSTECNFLREGE